MFESFCFNFVAAVVFQAGILLFFGWKNLHDHKDNVFMINIV